MSVWPKRTIDWVLRRGAISALALLTVLTPVHAQDLRKSALAAAEWAVSARNPQALADSIGLLLDSGYSTDPDDPFSVSVWLEELRGMDSGQALAEELEARQARGQLDGARRTVVRLAPGETMALPMTMVAREPALIEARLWRGSDEADVDLQVLGPDGATIAEDAGPDTGIVGYGVFVEFRPDTCLAIMVELTNRGTGEGRLAVLAPLSLRDTCEE